MKDIKERRERPMQSTQEKEIKDFLKVLETLWLKEPSQRFGQLLFNYTRFGTRTEKLGVIQDIFHYEDETIKKDIEVTLLQ